MKLWKPTVDAVRLFHEGQLALSEISGNGMRIDRGYLLKSLDSTQERIRALEEELRAAPEYRDWRRMFGEKTNIASPEQLSKLVFGDRVTKGGLGYRSKVKTKKGNRESAAEAALEQVPLPFVKRYLAAQKLRKARSTYLEGIRREMVEHDDGCHYIHPSFLLNSVESGRSSCTDPNVQNQPNRNPEMAEIVRRCFIPRPGCCITEIDYAQIEVRIGEAYHRDENMARYIRDTSTDMHRDMASKMFFLTTKQAKAKAVRHIAKNMMVFPQFYGSVWFQCAPNIWHALQSLNPKVEGTDATVLDHLKAKGVSELGSCDPKDPPAKGTFAYHIKEAEEYLWGEQFPGYAQWKREWYAQYQREGGCRFHTGFIMVGPHKKNEINNYCIQGSSFHCLLWGLPRINRLLRRYKFKTRCICEIHDCNVFDGPPSERDDLIHLCRQVMLADLHAAWGWITSPLEVEAEACPVDRSWHDKMALKEKDGVFEPDALDKWVSRYGDWKLQCA